MIKIFKSFLFFLVFIFSQHSFSILISQKLTETQLESLSQHPDWIRLIHYKKKIFSSQFESQADNLQFFLSPNGKFSPLDELKSTLESLEDLKKRDLKIPLTSNEISTSALCQFPARAKWLNELLIKNYGTHLPIENLKDCVEYQKFKQKLRAHSVTLVFSSYYINSPSSTFGHSLLRINRNKSPDKNSYTSELLDIGVNYAANATTQNPFLFAVLGTSGGFHGTFTVLPYFYKVREYNDYESRDLWEYDLALSESEVDKLVDHLWELSFTTFDYYYITENCSYHMLTLLEVAAPRLNLVNKIPFWIVPGETLQALKKEKGLIKNITFRPSIYRQYKERLAQLDQKELDSFKKWKKKNSSWRQGLDSHSLAKVLDVGLDYFDYKNGSEILLDRTSPKIQEKNQWLIERSQLPSLSPLKIQPKEDEDPAQTHSSARVGMRFISFQDQEFVWRFALHDFLDPVVGFPDFAKIDFVAFRWRYQKSLNNSLLLDQVNIMGITSLTPMNSLELNPSWRVNLGWEREPELTKLGTPLFAQTGFGTSYKFESVPLAGLISYFLLQGKISHNLHSLEKQNSFLSLGPVFGIRWPWSANNNLYFETFEENIFLPHQMKRKTWSLSQTYLVGKDKPWLLEARVAQGVDDKTAKGSLGVYYYF